MKNSAALLSAMANPKRLAILELISRSEMPVGELASRVGLSQSALSQHLAKLRAHNLVSTRRDAQTIYYSSRSESVRAVLETLKSLELDNEGVDLVARRAAGV
jgi:DNA-binding transcriptional ArsR family regulator